MSTNFGKNLLTTLTNKTFACAFLFLFFAWAATPIAAQNNYQGLLAPQANFSARADTMFRPDVQFLESADLAPVLAIATQPDRKVLIGGYFRFVAGQVRFGFARLNADGNLDTTFDPGYTTNDVFAIAIQPDGKILAGGSLSVGNGFIFRFNPDGSRDQTFAQVDLFLSPAKPIISTISVAPNGKIYIGGRFSSVNGTGSNNAHSCFARLNADGTLDNTFADAGFLNTGAINPEVNSVVLQSDGKPVVGGTFTSYNNAPVSGFVRLNEDGSRDTSYNPNSFSLALAIQPDNKVIAAVNDQVKRFNTSGGIDTGFQQTAANSAIKIITLQPDGKILIGGSFRRVFDPNGSTAVREKIARLNADGTIEAAFNPGDVLGTGFDNTVNAIALQADKKVLAGGYFANYGGIQQKGVIRLFGDSSESPRTAFDFDADGRADLSLFRPGSGSWLIQRSTDGLLSSQFGISSDKIIPGDFDGDGKTDIAVFRNGTWYLLQSQAGVRVVQWGVAGDIPQVGDFDGDGKADIAIFRNGLWYLLQSRDGVRILQWGISTDKPLVGDFDGDGKSDLAIYRNGIWYLFQSQAGVKILAWGIASDRPLVADFDGDGRSDVGVFRDGAWYVLQSFAPPLIVQYGQNGDVPIPADYDGDGKADVAFYRPSNATWYIAQNSSNSPLVQQFGASGDVPAASAYIP